VRLTDRWLLGLELGLLLGLGWLFVQTAAALGRLNDNSAVARYTPPPRPTASPTPLIRLAELPRSDHVHSDLDVPPTPAAPPGMNLLVTAAIVLPVVPPTPDPRLAEAAAQAAHATGIVIPRIQVDAPVVHGVEAESLKLGVGHYDASANPGEAGNIVLAGHNDAYGEVFRDLDQLQPGDEITLYSQLGAFRYRVRSWRIVEPEDVSALAPTATPTVTLISCYPYRIDTQRIIVVADLIEG
jgi:sortase A